MEMDMQKDMERDLSRLRRVLEATNQKRPSETNYANDDRAINEFIDGIRLQPKAEWKHAPIPEPYKAKMISKHR